MMKSGGQFLNKLNNIQTNNNFVSGGVNRYSQFKNRGGSQGQQSTFGKQGLIPKLQRILVLYPRAAA